MNVVSTSPSGTEILCALGVEPVAVSHACDHPPRVRELPSIDFSRVRGDSSAERHDQVRAVSAEGRVYRLDVETLRSVEPDLILSQAVCGVCAVDTTLVEEVLSDLDAEPDVVGLRANTLEDLFSCIERVGEVTDREERATELIVKLRERLDAIETRVEGRDRPRVAILEWLTRRSRRATGCPNWWRSPAASTASRRRAIARSSSTGGRYESTTPRCSSPPPVATTSRRRSPGVRN
ncbi:ABC transporter substrate-binding protein [Halalkalicoccus salilacus]|uniref:ABC transporter substrate-binding protein n=1 Tax=Halalkalicoccus sp. GCM10025704 TaxID=3252662 RepID=UPI00360FEAEA